jgi:chromosome segregation ATPase
MASQSTAENNKLKDQITSMRAEIQQWKAKAENEGVDALTREFSERLGKEQKTIHELKQQLSAARAESTAKAEVANDQATEQMIADLRAEGVSLSKNQSKLEKIIRQLRTKETETEKQIATLTARATKAETSLQEHTGKVKELSQP